MAFCPDISFSYFFGLWYKSCPNLTMVNVALVLLAGNSSYHPAVFIRCLTYLSSTP